MQFSSIIVVALATIATAAPSPAPGAKHIAEIVVTADIAEASAGSIPEAVTLYFKSVLAGSAIAGRDDLSKRFSGCGACAQGSDGVYKTCWSSYLGYYTYYLELC
jgi:hypothetical protein